MKIRIAIVLWWFGVITMLIALSAGAYVLVSYMEDKNEYSACSQQINAYEDRLANLQKSITNSSGAADELKNEEERAERMNRDFNKWVEVQSSEEEPPICLRPYAEWWLPLIIGIPAMLGFFALSFIFGGSFWKPPRES